MRKLVLAFTVLITAMTASAGFFDDAGKDLSLSFNQCPKDKQAKVEMVLNNTDLTKTTIVRDGQRLFKLYTKNNKNGLLALCEKDAQHLSANQTLSGIRTSFYCGNKVYTCNILTLSTSSGGGDHDIPVVIIPPGDGDNTGGTPPGDGDTGGTPPGDGTPGTDENL